MGRRAPKRSAEAVARVGAFKRKLLIIYKIKGIFSSFVVKYFITKLEKKTLVHNQMDDIHIYSNHDI